MNKTVFIKQNSPEIRKKLQKEGFKLCICSYFEDSIWLVYFPNNKSTYNVHGEGYCDEDDLKKYSPLERIQLWLEKSNSKDIEFFETIEDFLKKYKKK